MQLSHVFLFYSAYSLRTWKIDINHLNKSPFWQDEEKIFFFFFTIERIFFYETLCMRAFTQ